MQATGPWHFDFASAQLAPRLPDSGIGGLGDAVLFYKGPKAKFRVSHGLNTPIVLSLFANTLQTCGRARLVDSAITLPEGPLFVVVTVGRPLVDRAGPDRAVGARLVRNVDHARERLLMLFAVGVFIGCVAGLVAALALSLPDRMFFAKQTVPIIIALVALVLGSVALVESTRSHDSNPAPAAIATATTVPPAPPTSSAATPTTGARDPNGDIQVPNVLKLKEADALSIIQQSGLQSNVDTISLANVPSGFVMSQSPLPGSTAPPGTTVNLQISAPA